MLGAAKARTEAEGAFQRERAIGDVIPLGQPILVGHHSEKRHRRDIERMHSHIRKGIALTKAAEDLESRATAAEKNRAISSDDPEALDKLREKLAALEERHTRMVATNAEIRKGGDVLPRLVALGFSERTGRAILANPDAGRLGFADFELRNSAANMRRLKEWIADFEKRAATPPRPAETIGEATITEEDNRVRITFPATPPEAVRAALKRAGFRWSPSNDAWQRFASTQAWAEARRVLSAQGTTPPAPAPAPPTPTP